MNIIDDQSMLSYVPPEWLLVIAEPPVADQVVGVMISEQLSVRRASGHERVETLLAHGLPFVAVIDLDLPGAAEFVTRLRLRQVPIVLLGSSPMQVHMFSTIVPSHLIKPFSDRAISRLVDSIIGRR